MDMYERHEFTFKEYPSEPSDRTKCVITYERIATEHIFRKDCLY